MAPSVSCLPHHHHDDKDDEHGNLQCPHWGTLEWFHFGDEAPAAGRQDAKSYEAQIVRDDVA